MPSLTANDLKTRGIAAIEESLANSTEALVSARGQDRFVVVEVAQYHYLRECELDAALAQTRADVAAGRYVAESAQQHIKRMEALLAPAAKATIKRSNRPKVPAVADARAMPFASTCRTESRWNC